MDDSKFVVMVCRGQVVGFGDPCLHWHGFDTLKEAQEFAADVATESFVEWAHIMISLERVD